MKFRFLQLNIERGRFLDRVVSYIQKDRFDIVCLQEVAGGSLNYASFNCYEALIKQTKMMGNLAIYTGVKNDVTSYIGLATLYSKKCQILSSFVIWLKRFQEVKDLGPHNYHSIPRCALATLFSLGKHQLMVINTHLAWGPTSNDAVYKKNQAEKLERWMKTHVKTPFILSGDFNLNPKTIIVSRFSRFGINLPIKYGVTNTLNPRTHKAKHLFPSGLLVDYVISDKRLKVEKFFVEENEDLSDHFGLVNEFNL